MPSVLQAPTFPPEHADQVGLARTDGLFEVASTQGYGILVVNEAKKNELVATGLWTDITPT